MKSEVLLKKELDGHASHDEDVVGYCSGVVPPLCARTTLKNSVNGIAYALANAVVRPRLYTSVSSAPRLMPRSLHTALTISFVASETMSGL